MTQSAFTQVREPVIPSWDRVVRRISGLDAELFGKFSDVMHVESALTRKMVSFQSNKTRPFYRLYKYKEAFSADLVEYVLARYNVTGPILDCFAGAGTALFSSADMGLDSDGIEILPCGKVLFEGRRALRQISAQERAELSLWKNSEMWKGAQAVPLNTLRISAHAYSPATEIAIGQFLASLQGATCNVRKILMFALMAILEDVGYTRKDGQFLRWDNRSGRKLKSVFHKGHVPSFVEAMSGKINDMLNDLDVRILWRTPPSADINLHTGSCLDIMQSMPDGKYGGIITSPPYCNRYDYTRTYALELALLGMDESGLSALRQSMISCTVENRGKDLSAINNQWGSAVQIADSHVLLGEIVAGLRRMRTEGNLNNGGIPRMVEGYFREMACVIWECVRVLKPGGRIIMVNDNVRYGGIDVPVDLILADIAECMGLRIVDILILPKGKGNSSQQMGAFGRSELRKCVYCWEKL